MPKVTHETLRKEREFVTGMQERLLDVQTRLSDTMLLLVPTDVHGDILDLVAQAYDKASRRLGEIEDRIGNLDRIERRLEREEAEK